MGLFEDFRDIYKLKGMRAFTYGLVPYSLNYITNHMEFFGSTDDEYNDDFGFYWFMCSIMLWNPLNILIVRMQSIDYPYRRFRDALWDMLKVDGHKMFYAGLFPILIG